MLTRHNYWWDHIRFTGMIPVRQQMAGSSLRTYRNVVLLPAFTHLLKCFCMCGNMTCSWPKANLDVRVRYELAAFGRLSAVQTSHKGLIHKVPARVLSPACGLLLDWDQMLQHISPTQPAYTAGYSHSHLHVLELTKENQGRSIQILNTEVKERLTRAIKQL